MEKLTYRNESQLHNDAVKILLRSHLSWSGSDENMPSDDLNNVRGHFFNARADADFTMDEWDAMTEDERIEYEAGVARQFDEIAAEADRKWEAVKVMLDL